MYIASLRAPGGFHLLNCMKGDLHLSCLVGVKCCEFAKLVVLRLHRHEILLLTSTEVFPSAFCDSLTRGYIVVQSLCLVHISMLPVYC